MKQFFKMFFASLLAMVVAGLVVVGLIMGIIIAAVDSATSTATPNVTSNSILLIETDKGLHEQGEENSLAAFGGESSYSAGLFETIHAIRAAKTDNNIKGILLKLQGASNGWATMQQVREALLDFKSSKKKIYAYGEGITQRDYYLASVADVLYLNPVGGMELKGLASQSTFYKGALDKLDVKPEIFYAGKFKSATEPFRAEKMSDANKIQLGEVLHDIWGEMMQAVSAKTGMDTAAIQQLAATGAIRFATDAARYKLVDGVKYWDELEDVMRAAVGKKVDEKIPYTTLNDYANNNKGIKDGASKIAVLFAEGEIVDGKGNDYQVSSENMVKAIRQIQRDDKIKAVVLRVNSPGGSALASEVIHRELMLLKKKKPLIVSMGDVAASGGYYIASAADSIFALPTTITGSIGVFSMLFNVGDALKNKLGVTFDEVKTSPFADFPTGTRNLTPQEMAYMQAGVDTIYTTFKSRVSAGRKVSMEHVDSIAQGRVWTGSDAIGIGLVDRIGNLDIALKSAAAKANLKEYGIATYPERVDQFRSMLKRLKGGPFTAATIKEAMKEELGADYQYYQQLQWMMRINGRAQMALPYKMSIY